MPSYYGDPNAQPQPGQPQGSDMPVLRIPMTAPVRVSMPAARGGASGGANLGQAIDMKKIMSLLNQKYGAGATAGGDPDPDAPYLQGAAAIDALSGPTGDPDPDILYLPKTGGA